LWLGHRQVRGLPGLAEQPIEDQVDGVQISGLGQTHDLCGDPLHRFGRAGLDQGIGKSLAGKLGSRAAASWRGAPAGILPSLKWLATWSVHRILTFAIRSAKVNCSP
jgi:hypothetical protein